MYPNNTDKLQLRINPENKGEIVHAEPMAGSIPGRITRFSHVGIEPDGAAGRRVSSGISRFPPPLHSGTAPNNCSKITCGYDKYDQRVEGRAVAELRRKAELKGSNRIMQALEIPNSSWTDVSMKTISPIAVENCPTNSSANGVLKVGLVTSRSRNIEVRRVRSSAVMKGRGKRENPEKTHQPAVLSGMIPTCENPRTTPPGIEPSSPLLVSEQSNHYTIASTSKGGLWTHLNLARYLDQSRAGRAENTDVMQKRAEPTHPSTRLVGCTSCRSWGIRKALVDQRQRRVRSAVGCPRQTFVTPPAKSPFFFSPETPLAPERSGFQRWSLEGRGGGACTREIETRRGGAINHHPPPTAVESMCSLPPFPIAYSYTPHANFFSPEIKKFPQYGVNIQVEFPQRVNEVRMEQSRNERAGVKGRSQKKNRLSATLTCEDPGVNQPGIEPGSPIPRLLIAITVGQAGGGGRGRDTGGADKELKRLSPPLHPPHNTTLKVCQSPTPCLPHSPSGGAPDSRTFGRCKHNLNINYRLLQTAFFESTASSSLGQSRVESRLARRGQEVKGSRPGQSSPLSLLCVDQSKPAALTAFFESTASSSLGQSRVESRLARRGQEVKGSRPGQSSPLSLLCVDQSKPAALHRVIFARAEPGRVASCAAGTGSQGFASRAKLASLPAMCRSVETSCPSNYRLLQTAFFESTASSSLGQSRVESRLARRGQEVKGSRPGQSSPLSLLCVDQSKPAALHRVIFARAEPGRVASCAAGTGSQGFASRAKLASLPAMCRSVETSCPSNYRLLQTAFFESTASSSLGQSRVESRLARRGQEVKGSRPGQSSPLSLLCVDQSKPAALATLAHPGHHIVTSPSAILDVIDIDFDPWP
ncbi:hypothetical protein PR048_027102 [Dryococelus australis]|uniref:Uncharacterized protein n=1 Tax=Dryococelus australis TaxID=614101 RepID=A0ABQ9GEH7_9NEOP|nr:hypothetical protein PR048_027102 [Dryococelus australis]